MELVSWKAREENLCALIKTWVTLLARNKILTWQLWIRLWKQCPFVLCRCVWEWECEWIVGCKEGGGPPSAPNTELRPVLVDHTDIRTVCYVSSFDTAIRKRFVIVALDSNATRAIWKNASHFLLGYEISIILSHSIISWFISDFKRSCERQIQTRV